MQNIQSQKHEFLLLELYFKVHEMRMYQKQYFKGKNAIILHTSMGIEKQVDKILLELREGNYHSNTIPSTAQAKIAL